MEGNGWDQNDLLLVHVVDEIFFRTQFAEQVLVLVVLDVALLGLGDLAGFHRKNVFVNY